MTIVWFALALSVLMPADVLAQADPFEEINKRFQQRQQQADETLLSVEEQYRAKRQSMEAAWRKREQEIEERWQKAKREIEKKWDKALQSTKKEWVAYSADYDARSIVNFEDGTIEVSAVVPVPKGQKPASSDVLSAAQEEITRQFEQILAEQARENQRVLADQVVGRTGRPVSPQNAKPFIKEEVLPNLVVDAKPVESRDGVTRAKVTAKVKLAPDHVKKRAQQYLDVVLVSAKRFDVDPQLVLAVIQTESAFNPKAQSHIPAYGLMQLVPRAAARDAYNFVYKDDKVLDDVYLFDPANNVELGAAYLHILNDQIFKDLADGDKKNYVVISAYNWGPGNVRGKILKRFPVENLPEEQVFTLLSEKTPEETRNYLKRVTERMPQYEGMVRR
jgi:membrane-bound lytic murein transglycosylase C